MNAQSSIFHNSQKWKQPHGRQLMRGYTNCGTPTLFIYQIPLNGTYEMSYLHDKEIVSQ